jgi:hypothetical protein
MFLQTSPKENLDSLKNEMKTVDDQIASLEVRTLPKGELVASPFGERFLPRWLCFIGTKKLFGSTKDIIGRKYF